MSSSLSSSFSSLTLSIRPSMSPIPSSLLTNGWTLNGSKSSVCSPVPINITGDCVAATLGERERITLTVTFILHISHSWTGWCWNIFICWHLSNKSTKLRWIYILLAYLQLEHIDRKYAVYSILSRQINRHIINIKLWSNIKIQAVEVSAVKMEVDSARRDSARSENWFKETGKV